MKPFNLEEAKAGKAVCTKDGYPARIICFDKKSSSFTIVALVDFGNEELEVTYTNEGHYYATIEESDNDLFMVGEHKEGWINIYNINSEPSLGYGIYSTREEAQFVAAPNVVATIKIEWEE